MWLPSNAKPVGPMPNTLTVAVTVFVDDIDLRHRSITGVGDPLDHQTPHSELVGKRT